MKRYVAIIVMLLSVYVLGSLVFANPALLPKHPGYPASSDRSPVTGQSLANDAGQMSLTVEQSSFEAASSEDAHVAQRLRGGYDDRFLERSRAGQAPEAGESDIAPGRDMPRPSDSSQGR